jgi:hypothetical protein
MEFLIWVETRLDGRILERELVSSVERPASGIGLEEIGLKLEEGKAVLRKVQARDCPDSGRCGECCSQAMFPVWPESARQGSSNPHSPNGFWNRSSFLPTLFSLQMSRRKESAAIWPLHRHQLSGTSPELQYHYATWGQQSAVAFMKAALEDNGWTPTSRIRVLADGADGLSNLVNTAAEETTHRVLDWFHISMRLQPIEQMSPGVVTIVGDADPVLTELLSEKMDRVRFQMWNGHWQAALDRLGAIYRTTKKFLSSSCSTNAERIHRFRKHMLDLRDYLCRNQVALRNYAQDRRKGLRISSALAESAMSHLVNERMGKRQPMRWSAEGAHLLLQVRCAVLDNPLEMLFREWLPKFRRQTPPPLIIGCCPQP